MDVNGPVQVVVEMESTGSTISGQISIEGAPPSGFFGWLELIDRLERAAVARAQARSVTRAATESTGASR
jgi:hypothetical protein